MESFSILDTHAPLYCATSSPKTKTFEFDSNSSAKASFNASLTATSFTPLGVAYVLRLQSKDADTAGRRADRDLVESGPARVMSCGAFRSNRDAPIAGTIELRFSCRKCSRPSDCEGRISVNLAMETLGCYGDRATSADCRQTGGLELRRRNFRVNSTLLYLTLQSICNTDTASTRPIP